MMGSAAQPAVIPRKTDLGALRESFRVFNQVSRDLERAYSRLESRAAAVEGRLREANRRLSEKLSSLGAEAEELSGILEAIPSGVVVCDPSRTLTRVNAAAERILGRDAHELVGRGAPTLRGSNGQPVLLLGQAHPPVGHAIERRVMNLNGSERVVSGCVAVLPGGGHLEIFTDQTEVAHLRSQVNRLDTLAALGEMAAGVAHEVRNPMNGVAGFAGLLERAAKEDEHLSREQVLHYTSRIRCGLQEVDVIISNLLVWARPEQALRERVLLGRLFREVQEQIEEAGKREAGQSLVFREPASRLSLQGDHLKLKLVLGNLVRNALEAAGPGGRVLVSARAEKELLSIIVDDDGPGLDPPVRARLFCPFTTTKPSGTGLGLAIVKKMVDLHGGEVRLDPSPLGGARFVVSLPVPKLEGVSR